MNILEKEIEDLLFEALTEDPSLLSRRGLSHNFEFEHLRQPDLGNYGRPDIIGYSVNPKSKGTRSLSVSIFELKKDEINLQTLIQASRYATGVEQYIEIHNLKDIIVDTKIFLIGRSIDASSDFVFLLNQLYNVSAYTYSLDLSTGLKFTSHSGYFKSKHGFKIPNMSYRNLRDLGGIYYSNYTERANYIKELEDRPF